MIVGILLKQKFKTKCIILEDIIFFNFWFSLSTLFLHLQIININKNFTNIDTIQWGISCENVQIIYPIFNIISNKNPPTCVFSKLCLHRSLKTASSLRRASHILKKHDYIWKKSKLWEKNKNTPFGVWTFVFDSSIF